MVATRQHLLLRPPQHYLLEPQSQMELRRRRRLTGHRPGLLRVLRPSPTSHRDDTEQICLKRRGFSVILQTRQALGNVPPPKGRTVPPQRQLIQLRSLQPDRRAFQRLPRMLRMELVLRPPPQGPGSAQVSVASRAWRRICQRWWITSLPSSKDQESRRWESASVKPTGMSRKSRQPHTCPSTPTTPTDLGKHGGFCSKSLLCI